jgi:hypothetical protein
LAWVRAHRRENDPLDEILLQIHTRVSGANMLKIEQKLRARAYVKFLVEVRERVPQLQPQLLASLSNPRAELDPLHK